MVHVAKFFASLGWVQDRYNIHNIATQFRTQLPETAVAVTVLNEKITAYNQRHPDKKIQHIEFASISSCDASDFTNPSASVEPQSPTITQSSAPAEALESLPTRQEVPQIQVEDSRLGGKKESIEGRKCSEATCVPEFTGDGVHVSINQEVDSSSRIAIVSKEDAQKKFWGLGDRFWMQMIDGKHHKYGPMVYDQALHGRDKEPGFFQSLKNGCQFAADHLSEKLTVQFYKDLHKILCAHFNGKENDTEITAEKTGSFKNTSSSCLPSILDFDPAARDHYFNVQVYFPPSEENADSKYEDSDEEYRRYISRVCRVYQATHKGLEAKSWAEKTAAYWEKEVDIGRKIGERYPSSKEWVERWEKTWEKRAHDINGYIEKICADLHVEKFLSVSKYDQRLKVMYHCVSVQEQEQVVQELFDRYNKKINEINTKLQQSCTQDQSSQLLDEKLTVIADLFQKLEWLHPFQDGQGRVDLVLQAKLLSEEGFNPPILEEPYTSTWSLLPEWKEYLVRGMKLWRERL
jgi:hypothetical protein